MIAESGSSSSLNFDTVSETRGVVFSREQGVVIVGDTLGDLKAVGIILHVDCM